MTSSTKRAQKISIILALLIKISKQSPFTFSSIKRGGSSATNLAVCGSGTTHSHIILGWFNPGLQVAFNTQGSITANQFIADTSGNKQYAMIERGTDACYMPDPSYTGWMFLALVIEAHATLPDTCTVTRVVTTSRLISCSGTLSNIEDVLKFKTGTYDEVGKPSVFIFDKTNTPRNHGQLINIQIRLPFSYLDITETFVEFLVLRPRHNFRDFLNAAFRRGEINKMRRAYKEIDGLIMTTKTFVQRNVWDGLRGHILIPDPSDPFGAYKNSISFEGNPMMSQTLIVHFFITKPLEMTLQDPLLISIDTRPVILNNPSYTLKPFSYKVRIIRDTNNNVFVLYLLRYEAGVAQQTVTLSVPFSPANTDWLHFGVSLGYGILYFVDSDNARFRRTDAIHAWTSTNDYHADMTFEEDQPISTILTPSGGSATSTQFLTIGLQAFTDFGMTTQTQINKFGLRVWDIDLAHGSFLGYKIATSSIPDGRCFLTQTHFGKCDLYVFLKNEADINPKSLLAGSIRDRRESCSLTECPYCIYMKHCMNAKGGRNEDLYSTDLTFVAEDWEETRYNPANPNHQNEFKKVVNNQGKEYWFRCPPSCKFFLFIKLLFFISFSLIFFLFLLSRKIDLFR